MPIYTYECSTCHKVEEAFRRMVDHAKGPDCCGEIMQQKITPPMLAPILGGGNWDGYKCPVTGEFVTSRKQRNNIMAKHDLVEAGDSHTRARKVPNVSEHENALAVKRGLEELGHS